MKAKKPLQPVSETLKRSVARGWRQGKFGSVGRRGHTSCDVGYTSMTGLDLASINPIGYSTMANGAWAWHVVSEHWFERWVPKPEKGEGIWKWIERLGINDFFLNIKRIPADEQDREGVAAVNAHFAQLDWVDKESPIENPGETPE